MSHVFDNLYPAIVQCFGVILLGYFAGRLNIVTPTQAKGLGIFVSNFALPGIVIKSLITLDFSSVNWKFLSAVLAGKGIVFVIVIIFSFLLLKPRHLGKCGLNAIFATQSNDFGVGYPIVMALYGDSHPDLVQYVALVVPISFLILNPIGYILLEIDKRRANQSRSSKLVIIGHIAKGVLLNPVVLFTIIGIIANFIFNRHVPKVIFDIIEEFASSFSATTLFYLGLSMVGKITGQLGKAFITPLLLIFAKMILLPLTIREMVNVVQAGDTANATLELADFGFLYGTFPTAPTVFIYATMYGVGANMVASAMVVCTFLSAPLMFVSARMVTLKVGDMNMAEYQDLLVSTSFDICILSILCVIWVTVVFALSRRYRTVPHQFTLALLSSNFLACLGMLLFSTLDKSVLWYRYVEYVASLIGILSTRCWTAGIALTICLLKTKSLCYVLRIRVWLFLGCFGIPTLATGLLMLVKFRQPLTGVDPMFQYGTSQVILSAVILLLCLIVTITCLVVEHRAEVHQASYKRILLESEESDKISFGNSRSERLIVASTQSGSINAAYGDTYESQVTSSSHFMDVGNGDSIAEVEVHPQSTSSEPAKFRRKKPKVYGATNRSQFSDDVSSSTACENGPSVLGTGAAGGRKNCDTCAGCDSVNIEDLSTHLSLSSNGRRARPMTSSTDDQSDPWLEYTCPDESCTERQTEICARRLENYGVLTTPAVGDEVLEHELQNYQIVRHQLMLLLLCLSMFTGLVLCLWRLLKEDIGGIYIELEFIDAVFNFGQGFIVFAFFGLDTKLIIMPFLKTWRRIWYGAEEIHLPNVEDLDEDILKTCQQFLTYHKDMCERELVSDLRYRFRVYRRVFTGHDLTEWLLKVGLAEERSEAIAYGQRLLLGRVLHHVTKEYLFYDLSYLYRFNDECSTEDFECPLTGTPSCDNDEN